MLDPGVFRSDPVLEFGADGTLFYDSLTYDGLHSTDVFISDDAGATWSPPSFAYGGDKQWFGTMAVADDGRIDVIWNDTRDDLAGIISELRYSFSSDGGSTWSPSEVLSAAPLGSKT